MTFDLDTHFQSWDFSKNHAHFDRAHLIISPIFVFPSRKVIGTILIQQNVRNQHVYLKVMKQHIYLKMLIFRANWEKLIFHLSQRQKSVFSWFYQKGSILGYILLYNSYINAAIADTLMHEEDLYDLTGQEYRNLGRYETLKFWCNHSLIPRKTDICLWNVYFTSKSV